MSTMIQSPSSQSGGKLLNNQTIVNTALQLVDACWNTYASTATGIGPERFAYISQSRMVISQAVVPLVPLSSRSIGKMISVLLHLSTSYVRKS